MNEANEPTRRHRRGPLLVVALTLVAGLSALLLIPQLAAAQNSIGPADVQATGLDVPHIDRGINLSSNWFDEDTAVQTTADLTGTSTADVMAALRSGQSLSTYAAGYDVSESDLVTAIVTADQAKLAADVADGKITEAQATQDSADLTQRVTEEVERTGGAPTGRFVGRGMGIDQSLVIDTTATLTGTTADDVTAALAGGQTLAAYAEAHGSTESALVDAIVAAEQAQLIQQVAAGTLTQVQADEINADLTARVTDLVEQVGGPHSCPGMQGPNTTPSTDNSTDTQST